jgi:hypothetical protein
MEPDLTTYLEKRQDYLANRTMFPLEELAKYSGQWVAWSPDGTRVVAHATEPSALDDLIRAGGEDPEQCVVEGIPAGDSVIGDVECGLDRS